MKRNANGTYNIAFAAINLRAKLIKNGTVMHLLSIDQIAPIQIEFDGIKVRPKLVLKILRKFNIKDARGLANWARIVGKEPKPI